MAMKIVNGAAVASSGHSSAGVGTAAGIRRAEPTDDYELLQCVGSGTYGEVHKARHVRSRELAAVKVVKLEVGDNFATIQQEILVLRDCVHPNIIAYYGSYLRRDRLWIVMEYCAGGSLQDIYHMTGPLNELQIAFVARETLKGLAYLHRRGKVHRDVKGANILLTHSGEVKLADFGVAAQITATIGKRKSFIGTPYWMAPEVASVERGGGYGVECDVWAVGITAIELAELQPPLFDLPPMQVLYLMTKSSYKVPKLRDKKRWSPAMHDFVKCCLTKNPKRRPAPEKLLATHPLVAGPLSSRLTRELLDKVNCPGSARTPDPSSRIESEDILGKVPHLNQLEREKEANANNHHQHHPRVREPLPLMKSLSGGQIPPVLMTRTCFEGMESGVLPGAVGAGARTRSFHDEDMYSPTVEDDEEEGTPSEGVTSPGLLSPTSPNFHHHQQRRDGGLNAPPPSKMVEATPPQQPSQTTHFPVVRGMLATAESSGGSSEEDEGGDTSSERVKRKEFRGPHNPRSSSKFHHSPESPPNMLRDDNNHQQQPNVKSNHDIVMRQSRAHERPSMRHRVLQPYQRRASKLLSRLQELELLKGRLPGQHKPHLSPSQLSDMLHDLEESGANRRKRDRPSHRSMSLGAVLSGRKQRSKGDVGGDEGSVGKPVPLAARQPVFHGLVPSPQVTMGACFLQVLKSCEVTVNCAASWVHPANNKQYLIIGAEEGIYTLDLEELHENHLTQIHERRCTWLYVIDDVMVALQGKTPYLYRHNILQLVQQLHLAAITRMVSKQVTKLEVPDRYKPRLFLTTVRMPETRDCFQCCVERSVNNGSLYMACAIPSAILLFQWYDPQARFLLMKRVDLSMVAKSRQWGTAGSPGPSQIPYQPFSLIFGSAAHNADFPMVCIGVYGDSDGGSQESEEGQGEREREKLDFQLVDFNFRNDSHEGKLEEFLVRGHNAEEIFESASTLRPLCPKLFPWYQRRKLPVVAMRQLDRDTIFIAYNRRVLLTTVEHGEEKANDLVETRFHFDFQIDYAVVLPDSVLAFHRHGLQGRSFFRGGRITQELNDPSKCYEVIGDDRQIVMKTVPNPETAVLPPSSPPPTRPDEDENAGGGEEVYYGDGGGGGTLRPTSANLSGTLTATTQQQQLQQKDDGEKMAAAVDLCILTGHVSTMVPSHRPTVNEDQ